MAFSGAADAKKQKKKAQTNKTFANTSLITIPAGAPGTTVGPANPFPSTINATGLKGKVKKVTVTINGLTHSFADDVSIELQGPEGLCAVLMDDTGGGFNIASPVTLTFDDAASTTLPATNAAFDPLPITSGAFKPSNFPEQPTAIRIPFPPPAPPEASCSSALSVFNKQAANGGWNLFVLDDSSADTGQIAGGWSLNITTIGSSCTSANANASAKHKSCGAKKKHHKKKHH
jgi:subtilisin-like proprotein convertase family protein